MDTTATIQVAKGITDYGLLVMISAVYLVITAGMILALFKWFKELVHSQTSEQINTLHEICNNIQDLAEGMRSETQLRLRNVSGFAFDLAMEQVCHLITRVRRENHISDREATEKKVRRSLQVIYEDRKSRFDPFTYRGKPLSEYCNPEWITQVCDTVTAEIYHPDGENPSRAYTNVKLAYDNIKTDFYNRLNA